MISIIMTASFGIILSLKEIEKIRMLLPDNDPEFDPKDDDRSNLEIVQTAVKGFRGLSQTAESGEPFKEKIVIGKHLKSADITGGKSIDWKLDDSKIDKIKIAAMIDAFCDRYKLELREPTIIITTIGY